MEPQPLLDAAIHIEFTSDVDRSTILAQLSRVLTGLFSQMDVGFGVVNEDDRLGGRQTVASPRYFDEVIAVSVHGSSILFQTVADYPGWQDMRQQVAAVLEEAQSITEANISVDRMLLRYLNFFEESENMSDVVQCDLRLPESIVPDRLETRFAGGSPVCAAGG